jgi:hypothetical protein
LPLAGLRALEDLESKYKIASSDESANEKTTLANGENAGGDEHSAIVTRIKMLRKLVELRGERVLENVDVEKVVWLEGTNLHLTPEQELAVSKLFPTDTNASETLISVCLYPSSKRAMAPSCQRLLLP